jgi:hypothetical protein
MACEESVTKPNTVEQRKIASCLFIFAPPSSERNVAFDRGCSISQGLASTVVVGHVRHGSPQQRALFIDRSGILAALKAHEDNLLVVMGDCNYPILVVGHSMYSAVEITLDVRIVEPAH